MIEQARKVFDSYDPEPRFSGNRPSENTYKSGGSSLREKLMLAIERRKAKRNNKHSLFNDEREYEDESLYT